MDEFGYDKDYGMAALFLGWLLIPWAIIKLLREG